MIVQANIIQGKKRDFNEQIRGLIRSITETFTDDLLGAFRERSMGLRVCILFLCDRKQCDIDFDSEY